MDIEAARKQVRSTKPKEGYLVIQLNGEDRLVLPHKQGVVFLEALNGAEKFKDRWSDNTHIVSLEQGYIATKSMSAEDYEIYKIAALLNISPQSVRDSQQDSRT